MTRKEALMSLLAFISPLDFLKNELSKYDWDSDKEYVVIDSVVMINVLNKFLDKQINAEELEEWANVVELRDDIGYASEQLREMIFELANPILYGEISEDKIKMAMLSLNSTE